jgi:membrane fusion protein (multidrug efflux system)
LFLFAIIGLLIAAAVYGYGKLTKREAGPGERGGRGGQPIYVLTEPVKDAEFPVEMQTIGSAKARESIQITAKATETISRVNFADGQSVKAGFVIAEMTSAQQGAQLAEARATLIDAGQQFQRAQLLVEKGNISQALLDQRRAAMDIASARVRNQESQLSDRVIKAPFAGVLGLRQVSPGTLVRPGDVITTLDDASTIKVDAPVAEASMSYLKENLAVEARTIAFPDRTFQGTVAGVDSRVDASARTILVRIEIPNPDGAIKPGMLLTLTLKADARRSLSVAEDSIVPLGEKRFVYVAGNDSKAERREVATGRRVQSRVEILSGLKRGEFVVTEGTVKLRPGAPITTVPPSKDPPKNEQRKGRGGRGSGANAS